MLHMISGSPTILTACYSFLLIIQMFTPKLVAMSRIPNVDEFLIENQRTRTHTRQDYVIQREYDDEMSGGIKNAGPAYVAEPLDPDANPEELPALIVDYANMIRNNVILLDKSVETRTRKRGNVKNKYDERPFMSRPPCNCKSHTKVIEYGDDAYPSTLKTMQCNDTICSTGYHCEESYYNVIVLKKPTSIKDKGNDPSVALKFKPWVVHKEKITIGCSCVVGGLEPN